jgi:hypothetical protein
MATILRLSALWTGLVPRGVCESKTSFVPSVATTETLEGSYRAYGDNDALTARAVARGNITKLAATAVVALLIDLLPVRTIGYNENSAAAERESVNPH